MCIQYIGTYFINIYFYLLCCQWSDTKFCLDYSISSSSYEVTHHLWGFLETMTAIPTSFPLIKRLTTLILNDTDYKIMVACLLDCQAVWSLADVSLFLLFLHSHPQLGSSHLWNDANIKKKKGKQTFIMKRHWLNSACAIWVYKQWSKYYPISVNNICFYFFSFCQDNFPVLLYHENLVVYLITSPIKIVTENTSLGIWNDRDYPCLFICLCFCLHLNS